MTLRERSAASRDIVIALATIQIDHPPAAQRFEAELRRVYALLRRFPLLGRSRHFAEPGVRSMVLRGFPWIVFYVALSDRIEIVRVLHGAMDLERELGLD